MNLHKGAQALVLLLLISPGPAIGRAQEPIEYRVKVSDPASKLYAVEAWLPAGGDTTLVSLPAWTPGHYEMENYVRYIRRFRASGSDGDTLRWDKLDPDTWRIFSRGSDRIRVAFDFYADTVNLSGSLLKRDFGYFNGTNLFVYPEGHYEYPARVRFELPEGWRVATELADGDEAGVFAADDYHQLVDNPTFLGHFAIDSVRVDSHWIRMAVYPARYFEDEPGGARELALQALAKIARSAHRLFGEPPYDRYTTFVYLEEKALTFAGGLEHADSHLDILPAALFEHPTFTFRQFFYPLLSHEYYHAWNVKRIRPADLWPYEYDRWQSTPLLWVAEGITDYYAHVILTRTGLWGENEFLQAVRSWILSVEGQPDRQAVEDVSLDTWFDPKVGDRYLYYDKGAVIGLLLDIEIRRATQDANSLDDVMRRLYREHYLQGRGFDTADIMAYLGEFMGEEAADDFYRDYVDGRDPLPYRAVLAGAALDFRVDTIVEPFFGAAVRPDGEGRMIVREVVPGSAAELAGLRVQDHLKWVGALEVAQDWGDPFKRAYGDSVGLPVTVVYERDGREARREVPVRTRTRYEYWLGVDRSAGERGIERWRKILEGG